jgi:secondary thiamine-phosphate synthase enzyme
MHQKHPPANVAFLTDIGSSFPLAIVAQTRTMQVRIIIFFIEFRRTAQRALTKNKDTCMNFLYNTAMKKMHLRTNRRCEAIDITPIIKNYLIEIYADTGLLAVYCPHTTAGITINENADPDVRRDMLDFLERSVPEDDNYAHAEGNSDAHIKSTLVNSSQILIVEAGKLLLGQWQGVFFMEFDGPRDREFWVHFMVDITSIKK